MICEAGEVVIVPFPFVDSAAKKRRPSLVLSHLSFNEAHGHFICAMITTAAHSTSPSDIAIADLTAAGLSRSCVIRWKLFTLPNAIILKRAGALGAPDRDKVFAAAPTILC